MKYATAPRSFVKKLLTFPFGGAKVPTRNTRGNTNAVAKWRLKSNEVRYTAQYADWSLIQIDDACLIFAMCYHIGWSWAGGKKNTFDGT